jgi:hypothetical protein
MMQPLDKSLRNRLERTIKDARDSAEDAARAALEQLGVGEAAPFAHLREQERELRRKLRVHGRQLGDSLNGGKIQTMDRLIEEVAYEHWHRMLFARFLAENNLLMYWPDGDDEPIDVNLDTCQGLLDDGEERAGSVWELAARFASRMLPQIFRLDSPVFRLALPPEHQQKLELLVADLPLEVFTASDSLGWVYQFWQAKKKEQVNNSEVKIGARELPAVTQLFTEPYMVSFLLDNSLGAWWAARRLTETDLQNAKNEEELRRKAAIPGVPLDYLRFVQQDDGAWTPAAGTFDGWPEPLADLKTLDPCCGSGHFLVAAFLMLVPMRMERDGLSSREAVDAVLRENIHGLELDQRCVELAAFALALTAWKYSDAGGYRMLPELNVACSGLAVGAKKEEWIKFASHAADMIAGQKTPELFSTPSGTSLWHTQLSQSMDALYRHFSQAPVLGSLIDPNTVTGDMFRADFGKTAGLLQEVLKQETESDYQETGVVAQGLAKAATLLAGKYSLIVTNVPYLARGKQDEILRNFCESRYPAAKNDLATVFLDRCLDFCSPGGTTSIVLPQNWLFLTSYKKFREKLLKNDTWHLIARLGSGAFETISGEVVKAILITLSKGNCSQKSGASCMIRGVDVSKPHTAGEKAEGLLTAEVKSVEQAKQLGNPDARVALEDEVDFPLLSKCSDGLVGLQTSDDPMFVAAFWEVDSRDGDIWELMQATPDIFSSYAGQSWMVRWEKGEGLLLSLPTAYPTKGLKAVGKSGIAIHRMGQLFPYHYGKERFHQNVATIIPKDEVHLPAIWCFCSSPEYNEAVRQIDQSLKVTNATLVKVPFDLDHWTKVAEEKYPNGLPMPYTDDPTQWIFHGHPCGSVIWYDEQKLTAHGPLRNNDTVLHVAVARLLGYRWPAELDAGMELADEQREWVKRCEALAVYADDDGIVCIPSVRGEASATDRLLNLLAAAYGEAWSSDTLATLLKSADHAGKTLETWLREKFFTQHCKLFQHRPFIWHIWDGLRDGFAALVNYHKLGHKNLETLTYTYLGDWISRQKQEIANGVDGAEERLAAAEALKKKLELILEGEAPYDIFIRWKPLKQQPIGWNPDLNDGVRLNIRPFLTVPDVGKKGAGVLRDKPNIKWDKDRGKDVESAPWYHVFDGDRINDHHLTLAEKRAAREAVE